MRGEVAVYKCECCGGDFPARVADRARGWARFCSKRCKALKQMRHGPKGKPVTHINYPDGTSTVPRKRHHGKAPGTDEDRQAAEAMARRMYGWTS